MFAGAGAPASGSLVRVGSWLSRRAQLWQAAGLAVLDPRCGVAPGRRGAVVGTAAAGGGVDGFTLRL